MAAARTPETLTQSVALVLIICGEIRRNLIFLYSALQRFGLHVIELFAVQRPQLKKRWLIKTNLP